VLGREVEKAALNVVVGEARSAGVGTLYGRYLPTSKNKMVVEHYKNLGFDLLEQGEGGASLWQLDLGSFEPFPVRISIVKG
jgi:predicted enzyme involved in methoxymalonyl-ACP biosynthesis